VPPQPEAPVARPVAAPVPVAAPEERAVERERSVTRFTARDYTYVARDVRRIIVVALAILIAIIVLSFFLP
jgi:hypothetical protein